MKKYEYLEISLGTLFGIQTDRISRLNQFSKEGWRLISTYQVQLGPNQSELRGILEKEVSPLLGNSNLPNLQDL